jgi:AsmA-like C-terminal region
MNKRLKKIFKISGITFLSLIVLAFLIPIVFKKQVHALVKKEINKNLDAKVDFKDVKLSLFRHFPKATISIKGLTVVGKNFYANDTLIASEKIDITAGLFSVLKGKDIKVYGLFLESPRIHLLVNQFGKANWDIAKASTDATSKTDTSASNFKLTLKKYEINNGFLVYEDKQANSFIELNGLNHSGRGDLSADVFTLSTSTQAASAYLSQDDIPYLFNTKTDLDADIMIDNNTNTYTFKTYDVQLNALKLSVDGFVRMMGGGKINMDIKFGSPTNSFKNILSMVPAIYKKDFEKIKTSGDASFNGFVKGTYSKTQMPAYDVNLEVRNGSFQYPDLSKPVKNIQLSLKASNPDGKPDNAIINISKGHLEMDNEPFDFRFVYKNPETTEMIDAAAKGKLDLSQLSKFIKLDKETKLSGLIWADAFVKGPLKAIETQSGAFSAGGFFDIKNLYYSSADFPQPIKNGNIKATLENSGGQADKTVINISSGHIEVGNDPVDFSLQLRNPVSSVDFSGNAIGKFTLDHIKQFTDLEPGTVINGLLNADLAFSGNKTAIDQKQYDKISLNGNVSVDGLKYKSTEYTTGINISNTQLAFNPKNVTLSKLEGNYLNTFFSAKGELNNLIGYLMEDQELKGTLNVLTDKVNLNEWMGTTANTSAEITTSTTNNTSAKPFLVPANLNLTLKAQADKVKFDKVDYNNISGTLLMNDEKINFQDFNSDVLDGKVIINGSYSTKINKLEPDISMSYEIKDLDVQKAFLSYNTIQALMPIGKFLAGKLNSQLSMTGNLHGDMMPKLNSLSGKANFHMYSGVLKNFAPVDKLATLLQIDRLKSISLKDIKNYIEFANGKVFVKPFNVRVDSIEMLISGFHGFDQSIDYAVQMKLPRKLMGTRGNDLVNKLAAEANSKGIPIKLGETINLNIKVTGSISDPSISINLKEVASDVVKDLEKQAQDFAKAKLDSAKKKTTDSLNMIKKQGEDKLKEKLADIGIDTANLNLNNVKDTLKKRVADSLKKKIFKKLLEDN